MDTPHILVLGAAGLAGRTITKGLAKAGSHKILATGRNMAGLQALFAPLRDQGVETALLDASQKEPVSRACRAASLVINAVGPYAQHGASIARLAIEAGRPYIDCANEQVHYQWLQAFDAMAQRANVPVITAAGAIPGLSTLLMALAMERLPGATSLECVWAQRCHAYPDAGFGSIMSGILEAVHAPVSLQAGREVPVRLGQSMKTADLPAPFGRQPLFELPTVDALTLPRLFEIQDLRTWFYMGEQPTWLFPLIRFLQPHRRPWAYSLLERIGRSVNAHDGAKAAAAKTDPVTLLQVTVRAGEEVRSAEIWFRDGALPTAALTVRLAGEILGGRPIRAGILTPLDLYRPEEVLADLGDAVLSSSIGFDPG